MMVDVSFPKMIPKIADRVQLKLERGRNKRPRRLVLIDRLLCGRSEPAAGRTHSGRPRRIARQSSFFRTRSQILSLSFARSLSPLVFLYAKQSWGSKLLLHSPFLTRSHSADPRIRVNGRQCTVDLKAFPRLTLRCFRKRGIITLITARGTRSRELLVPFPRALRTARINTRASLTVACFWPVSSNYRSRWTLERETWKMFVEPAWRWVPVLDSYGR